MQVAERQRERVRGVGPERAGDGESHRHAAHHGVLVGATVADGGDLHLRRRVLVQRHARTGNGRQDGAARLAEAECALHVARQEGALEGAKIGLASAEVTMLPQSTVAITGKPAEQMVKLLEALEDHEDVQSVSSNMDIAAEELERLSA